MPIDNLPQSMYVDPRVLAGDRPNLFHFVRQQSANGVPRPIQLGTPTPLSSLYGSLGAAQVDYPYATALTNELAQVAMLNAIAACQGKSVDIPNGIFPWDNSNGYTNVVGMQNVRLNFAPGALIRFNANNVGITFNACNGIRLINPTIDYAPGVTISRAAGSVLNFVKCTDPYIENGKVLRSAGAGTVFERCIRPATIGLTLLNSMADGLYQTNCADGRHIGALVDTAGDDLLSCHNYLGTFVCTFAGSPATFTAIGCQFKGGVGDTVQFTSSGTLPTGIAPNTSYYIVNVVGSFAGGVVTCTFQIATSPTGAPLAVTGGSGTLTVTDSSGPGGSNSFVQQENGIISNFIARNGAARGLSSSGGRNLRYANGYIENVALSGINCDHDAVFQSYQPDGVYFSDIRGANIGTNTQPVYFVAPYAGVPSNILQQPGHPLTGVLIEDHLDVSLADVEFDGIGGGGLYAVNVGAGKLSFGGTVKMLNCAGNTSGGVTSDGRGFFIACLTVDGGGTLIAENTSGEGYYFPDDGRISLQKLVARNTCQTQGGNTAFDFASDAVINIDTLELYDDQTTATAWIANFSPPVAGRINRVTSFIFDTTKQLVIQNGNFPNLTVSAIDSTSTPRRAVIGSTAANRDLGLPFQISLNDGPPIYRTSGSTGLGSTAGESEWHDDFDGARAWDQAFSQGVGGRQRIINPLGGDVSIGTFTDLGALTLQIANAVMLAINTAITDGGGQAWNIAYGYLLGSVVSYSGVVYVAIQDDPGGHQPDISPAYWAVASLRSMLNITGSGLYGTVTTDGTTNIVALISGSKFPATIAGETITLAGNPYVVSTWNSATSITLASSPGTNTAPVPYSYGGSFALQALSHGSFLPLLLQPLGGVTKLGAGGLTFDDSTVQTTAAIPGTSGPAGGVLSGTYPNPSFRAGAHIAQAVNAAGPTPTQAEFNAFVFVFNTLLAELQNQYLPT